MARIETPNEVRPRELRQAAGCYVRSDDGAVMLEVKPHQFVNAAAVRELGLELR